MSEYTDIRNNTHEVREECILDEKERKKIEEEIVEELYKIFTK